MTPELLSPTLWDDVLDQLQAQLAGARQPARASRESAQRTVTRALARTHSHLLVALEGSPPTATDTVSQLVASATALLRGTQLFCEAHDNPRPGLTRELDNALALRLNAYEHAVLAGETTYSVSTEDANDATARMRELVTNLSNKKEISHGDLLSLRLATADLGSLVVRAAANAAASGRADEAPEARSPSLDEALRKIALELADRANAVERPADTRGDVAAHHLAAALRVQASEQAHRAMASARGDGVSDPVLKDARDAWLALATHEYVAVAAIDKELDTPAYHERFESLTAAIVESAANVLYGARLAHRPRALRHRDAWQRQATALTYALEAYVAGLRGDAQAFAQSQLIALTRLVRAVPAIALLDLRRASSRSSNGHANPT